MKTLPNTLVHEEFLTIECIVLFFTIETHFGIVSYEYGLHQNL